MSQSFFEPLAITTKDKSEQRVAWATDILLEELKESAYAEAAFDLHKIYHHEIDVWSVLQRRFLKRVLTPQQRMVVDILFKVSQAGNLSKLAAAYAEEMPAFLEFSVRW